MCDIVPENYITSDKATFPSEDIQYTFSQNHNTDNRIIFQVSIIYIQIAI